MAWAVPHLEELGTGHSLTLMNLEGQGAALIGKIQFFLLKVEDEEASIPFEKG